MDLSRFDTRERAEAGVDVALVINGDTVFGDDGEEVTFCVRGPADDRVADAVLRSLDKPSRTAKDAREADLRILRVALVGWSDNFTYKGETLSYSQDAIEKIGSIPQVRRFLVAQVLNEANFSTSASED